MVRRCSGSSWDSQFSIIRDRTKFSIHSASLLVGIPTVESMVMYVAQEITPIDVKSLKKLGIDEISLVKGQGKFIVVLVDLETHKLVGLVSERKQSKIKETMKEWGNDVLLQIEEVSMDMTGNYKSLVQKICPNAVVTVDRFHITKMVNEELNKARIDQNKTAEALNSKERAKLFGRDVACYVSTGK